MRRELIGTTVLGYFIFSNFPDPLTWLGTAIMIAFGLYIALLTRRLLTREGGAVNATPRRYW